MRNKALGDPLGLGASPVVLPLSAVSPAAPGPLVSDECRVVGGQLVLYVRRHAASPRSPDTWTT